MKRIYRKFFQFRLNQSIRWRGHRNRFLLPQGFDPVKNVNSHYKTQNQNVNVMSGAKGFGIKGYRSPVIQKIKHYQRGVVYKMSCHRSPKTLCDFQQDTQH